MSKLEVPALDNLVDLAKGFIQGLMQPSINELGLFAADNIKGWRTNNMIRIVANAEKKLKAKGLKTKQVDLKVLAPMLEDCSRGDDEYLQDKWSNLLANIAQEDSKIDTPLFSNILRDMSHNDAKLFEKIYLIVLKDFSNLKVLSFDVYNNQRIELDILQNSDLSLENLKRLRLVKELASVVKMNMVGTPKYEAVSLTKLGYDFLNAVTF